MNPASIDVKDMLENESSLGLIFATNLFVGKEPTTPANCVTVFDTPGGLDDVTLNNDSVYQRPFIQIRVRNLDYDTGWALIDGIRDLLHGKGPETWNGTLYSSIVSTGDPALLDWDNNDRPRFFINFAMQRR